MGYLAVKYATNNWGKRHFYSNDPVPDGCCLFITTATILIIITLIFLTFYY